MIVTYSNNQITCATAIKGSDYIHLLDSAGKLLAAFDGVSNFSGFSISGGSWTSPKDATANGVAIVREDGTLCSCGVPLGNFHRKDRATVLTNTVQYGTTLPTSGTEGQLFFLLV